MGCQTEVEIGRNLTFTITTHDPDTGVLTDADAAPTYRVYEDETAVAILTGTMAKLDDVNTTGFYSELLACTAANGFENNRSYNIYIEATVDGDRGGISYAFRAVTGPVVSVVASSITGSVITVRPYTTWSFSITGLGSLVGRTSLWFTAKDEPSTEADTAALLQVEETAGLTYINGSAGVGANATLVVTDPVNGDLTVTVNKSQTGLPEHDGYYWDVKIGIAGGADTLMAEGEFNIGRTVITLPVMLEATTDTTGPVTARNA
jgi:hypothetical protein